MLSYESLQDILNAVVVIFIVSIIIAVAWLSTNVREQPLIATAVVVFQSDVNADRYRSTNSSDPNATETRNGVGQEGGEAISSQSTTSVKANEGSQNENSHIAESSIMEVNPKVEGVSLGDGKMEGAVSDSNSSSSSTEKTCELDKDIMENKWKNDIVQSGTQISSSSVIGDGHLQNDENTPKSDCPNPSETRSVCDPQEMEVRNRRLQHFVTMGGAGGVIGSSVEENSPKRDALSDGIAHQNSTHRQEEAEIKTSSSSSRDEEERPPGSMRIRIKFLDETQKLVFAKPTEQVGTFKRQHFSIEMDANRRIRLIFNGQLLSKDSSTLAQYGLFDNCVVHCHVSQPQVIGNAAGQIPDLTVQDEDDAYISGLLAPLLYCVMVVMWYLRYEYSHLFNTMSTVILLFLTALLIISTYLLYITQNVPGSESAAQISSRHEIDTNTLL